MNHPPFSLLGELHRFGRALEPLGCPGCGGGDRRLVWRYDRYFLPVELSICEQCGLAHLARGLAGEAASDFYRTAYPRLMRQPPPRQAIDLARAAAAHRMALLSRMIGPLADVIDIGSGLGFFLDACRRTGCVRYQGIEPGEPQYRYAIAELGLGGHVEGTDIARLATPPFRPRVITLFHVLEHLELPGLVLDRLAAWLSGEGWLVVEVPDLLADWSSLGLMQIHISHRSYFTAETLSALLARHGFAAEIVQREPDGIYPGNLRVLARPRRVAPAPSDRAAAGALAAHIRRSIRPWSWANGYPRAAARLLRIAASGG